jgi:hypothetical protein
MTENPLVFVVTGALNRGKSSVVSTLTENDAIAVSAMPGTTRKANRYDYKAGGRTLYALIDTPGFERAAKALYMFREKNNSDFSGPAQMKTFFSSPEIQKLFPEETEIMLPILDGGAIIYVVDTSMPPSPASNAEMELLRHTGQPRIALINKHSKQDNERWTALLNQYFNIIRHFDAAGAGFHERIKLLSILRDIDPRWHEKLNPVIDTLQAEWQRRRADALTAIAKLISDVLLYRIDRSFQKRSNMEDNREKLRNEFLDTLLELEKRYQQTIRRIYKHKRYNAPLEVNESTQSADFYDLKQWEGMGVDKTKFALTMAAIGGATGMAADIMLGGLSGGLPTMGTAALFGGAAWFGYDSIEFSHKRLGRHRLLFQIKPKSGYPFAILDRAMAYYLYIQSYAHGRRDDSPPPKTMHVIGKLERQALKTLTESFISLSKTDPNAFLALDKERQKLLNLIKPVLEKYEQ